MSSAAVVDRTFWCAATTRRATLRRRHHLTCPTIRNNNKVITLHTMIHIRSFTLRKMMGTSMSSFGRESMWSGVGISLNNQVRLQLQRTQNGPINSQHTTVPYKHQAHSLPEY